MSAAPHMVIYGRVAMKTNAATAGYAGIEGVVGGEQDVAAAGHACIASGDMQKLHRNVAAARYGKVGLGHRAAYNNNIATAGHTCFEFVAVEFAENDVATACERYFEMLDSPVVVGNDVAATSQRQRGNCGHGYMYHKVGFASVVAVHENNEVFAVHFGVEFGHRRRRAADFDGEAIALCDKDFSADTGGDSGEIGGRSGPGNGGWQAGKCAACGKKQSKDE